MSLQTITIIGSGHGGCAAAAVLSLKGYKVKLCKVGNTLHIENFRKIQENGGIYLEGIEGDTFTKIDVITTDIKEALKDAQLICIFYVSTYHEFLAEKIVPFLEDGQMLFINPGYMGSLVFSKKLKEYNIVKDIIFIEGETLPFTSRIKEPGIIEITSRNVIHPVATFPGNKSEKVVNILNNVFPGCIPRKNIIEVALHNPNLIIHTVGTIMNIGRIEFSKGEFYMYREGFTPSIWNIVKDLDKEKMEVMERYEIPPTSYFDEFRIRTFGDTSIDPFKGFKKYADESPKGPESSKSRYITEDVPIGLGLLHSLGRKAGVNTPICDSLINIASSINQTNYWEQARTLEKLGISNLNVREIIEYLEFGGN